MVTARDMGVDCIISLDADLQDDIAAIPDMIAKYMEGNDIVYGVRNDRSTDTPFKRRTAHMPRTMGLISTETSSAMPFCLPRPNTGMTLMARWHCLPHCGSKLHGI